MNYTIKLFQDVLGQTLSLYGESPRVEVSESDGYFSFKLVKNPDNLNIKNIIANYKRNLDELDDDIFVNVLEDLASYNVNLKKFDDILNKEELSEGEEVYASYMIGFMNSLIREHITNKIQELNDLKDKF